MIWSKIDDYHMRSGDFTITKPGRVEFYPYPYTLYHRGNMVGSYADSKLAIEEAKRIANERMAED